MYLCLNKLTSMEKTFALILFYTLYKTRRCHYFPIYL